jgi:flagellin-like protein
MNEKGAKMRERRRSYLRRLRGEKKAVSPVVATLILILIAVAAAAALYLWLVAWQGGVTAGIGSPGAQSTLSIGGSTSVYPFAVLAATQFEQNNTDVKISVNQGGSGAGMAAVCSGQVDIGEASAFFTPQTLTTSYGCPSTVAIEIVAYDGVDAIVSTTNSHGLQSISWDTVQSLYSDASTTAPTSGIIFSAGTNTLTMDGQVWAAGAPGQGGGFAWDQIPACATAELGVVNGCAGSTLAIANGGVFAPSGVAPPVTEVSCGGMFANDLCSPAADATSCGFTVCAGGLTSGTGAGNAQATIFLDLRSDVSGTTQSFLSRLVAAGESTATGTTLSVGFTGCSGDNQFDGCGLSYSSSHGEPGNPAVISAVAGSKDSLGYASDGLVQAGGSGVVPVNFQGYGQSVIVNLQGESTALKAIAKGISDFDSNSGTYATDQAYIGWRPFLNVETAPPTGEALRYLQFVMDPANNENLAAEAQEISVYASGLAGVVPVTPIP